MQLSSEHPITPSWPHRYEPGCIWHLAQRNGIGFIVWLHGEPLSRKAMPEHQKVPKGSPTGGGNRLPPPASWPDRSELSGIFFAMLIIDLVVIGALCWLRSLVLY